MRRRKPDCAPPGLVTSSVTSSGPGMLSMLRAFAVGGILACGGDVGGEAPRVGAPCDDGEPARCGRSEGSDTARNAVLICDGDTWSEAHDCGVDETCRDDEGRGAVVCTDELDEVIYGEHAGACAVPGAQSCSFERDAILVCEGGKWTIDTDCTENIQHCAFVPAQDDADCSEPDGCLVCA